MGKLTFKGDAPVKKKKKSHSRPKTTEEETSALTGWLPIPSPALALGPLYITLTSSHLPTPVALALQPTTGKIYPFAIPTTSAAKLEALKATHRDAIADLDAEDLEALVDDPALGGGVDEGPQDVHHVFVCTRIPDSQNKVTFRSATNRYLASDELGVVSAASEARGFQEEWSIESPESGSGSGVVVIKSAYGKMLSADVVAGGKVELRADEENEGDGERWKVWMQGEYVEKARKQLEEREGVKGAGKIGGSSARGGDGLTIVGDLKSAEMDNIKKYQARGQGRTVDVGGDDRDLKRARKDGKLGEAMLERRVKLKSDRYC
ncbi:actin-bundling protein [Pseudohyphozyma bogoriensis]|nr:actin-bundling protein [Pseudohyphozyma bogoriensis]